MLRSVRIEERSEARSQNLLSVCSSLQLPQHCSAMFVQEAISHHGDADVLVQALRGRTQKTGCLRSVLFQVLLAQCS